MQTSKKIDQHSLTDQLAELRSQRGLIEASMMRAWADHDKGAVMFVQTVLETNLQHQRSLMRRILNS